MQLTFYMKCAQLDELEEELSMAAPWSEEARKSLTKLRSGEPLEEK